MVLQGVESQPKPIHRNVKLKFVITIINVILIESYTAIKKGMDYQIYPLNLSFDIFLLHEMRILENDPNIPLNPRYNGFVRGYNIYT